MTKWCKVANCNKEARKKGRECSMHEKRRRRERDLVKDAFGKWKSNAKRRGVPFAATLEYFRKWCSETNYIQLRGLGADDMTIDTDNNYLGYRDGHYMMKTRRQNAREGRKGKPIPYKPGGVPF